MAARDNNISVVMCCGEADRVVSTGGHRFVDDFEALARLQWLVNVREADGGAADKTMIFSQVLFSSGGAKGLNEWISNQISRTVAASFAAAAEAGAAAGSVLATAAIQSALCSQPGQLAILTDRHLPAAVRKAAASGAEVALALLLARGAPVDEPDSKGERALMLAALAGHVKVVKALLDAKAAVNQARNDGCTPLFMAAENGHADVVSVLLAAGAAVDKADFKDRTPLFVSAQNGQTEVVDKLVAAGAAVDRPNAQNITPLSVAAYGGQKSVVFALLAAGADREALLFNSAAGRRRRTMAGGGILTRWPSASGDHHEAFRFRPELPILDEAPIVAPPPPVFAAGYMEVGDPDRHLLCPSGRQGEERWLRAAVQGSRARAGRGRRRTNSGGGGGGGRSG